MTVAPRDQARMRVEMLRGRLAQSAVLRGKNGRIDRANLNAALRLAGLDPSEEESIDAMIDAVETAKSHVIRQAALEKLAAAIVESKTPAAFLKRAKEALSPQFLADFLDACDRASGKSAPESPVSKGTPQAAMRRMRTRPSKAIVHGASIDLTPRSTTRMVKR